MLCKALPTVVCLLAASPRPRIPHTQSSYSCYLSLMRMPAWLLRQRPQAGAWVSHKFTMHGAALQGGGGVAVSCMHTDLIAPLHMHSP